MRASRSAAAVLAWLALIGGACRSAPVTTERSPTDVATAAAAADSAGKVSDAAGATALVPAQTATVPVAAGETGTTPAQIALASSDLAVGRERFAFALLTPGGTLIQDAAATVTFLELDGGAATPVTTTQATFYPAQLEPAGLYVVHGEFTKAGPWGAEITATLVDGGQILPQRVRFEVRETPQAVGNGAVPPPTANRTLATEPDIAKLTSDPSPDADFYRLTVDEAAASGRPTVIVFATPGHCTSRICGPVLDEVKTVKAAVGGAVNFIHIDVYEQFNPPVLAEAMGAWGLRTEPWVYVLGADGRIAERLEGSVTAAELGPVVQRVLGTATP